MSISEELAEIVTSLFTPREQIILSDRIICLDRRVTLRALGKRLNVTQERIRQIQDKILRRVITKRRHLSGELSESVKGFSDRAGEAIQMEEVFQSFSELGLETSKDIPFPTSTLLFLYYAGPYQLHKSLLIRTTYVNKLELLSNRLWHRLQKDKAISIDDADDIAKKLGITSPDLVDEAIIELQTRYSHVYEAGEGRYTYGPTASDRAFNILTSEAQPMDIKSLAVRSDTAMSSLINVLSSDSRFIRVNKRVFGLADWGMEEYEGIVASIHKALLALGGSAKLYDVADWVTERFDVSWTSVITYASSHHDFILTDGILRTRRPDEEARGFTNIREMGETAGCLIVDGCPTLRVTIDEQLQRGSGRPIPRPWAIKAGVKPGERLFLQTEESGVIVSWYGTEPTIGSLRNLMFRENWPDRGLGFLILKKSGLTTLTAPPPLAPTPEPSMIAAAIGTLFAFTPSAEGHPLAGSFWEALGTNLGLQATQRVPGVILARLASRREPFVAPYVDALKKALLVSEANGLRVQVDH